MAGSHSTSWPSTLTKTQQYLRNRITGSGCERDEIEAWREFYKTQEPIIRLLVIQNGVDKNVDACVEEVWLDLVANLNSLQSPQTYDSFLFWLKNSVRRTAAEFRLRPPVAASNMNDVCQQTVAVTRGDTLNDYGDPEQARFDDRLLHLRLVEAQPVERVARTLGLTTEEVVERQRDILKRILLVLVKLDIGLINS